VRNDICLSNGKKYLTLHKHSYILIVILHSRGDTLSVDCKSVDLNYRLDLRIITDSEKGPIKITTGEFASTKKITEEKLYNDKLKSVLISKCHLNSILKKMEFIPENQIRKVNMPILQIMGQNISLYALTLIDKQLYSVQNIMDVEYPRTIRGVRNGGVQKILDLLEQLEVSYKKAICNNVQQHIAEEGDLD
jgi:hypothetical protein